MRGSISLTVGGRRRRERERERERERGGGGGGERTDRERKIYNIKARLYANFEQLTIHVVKACPEGLAG